MIIIVPSKDGKIDKESLEAAEHLGMKYPHELIKIATSAANLLSFDGLLVGTHNEEGILEKNGTPPESLTFIGHSSSRTGMFGPFSSLEFAKALVKEIDYSYLTNPLIARHLKEINLLGCATGLVNAMGKSFAQEVQDFFATSSFSIIVRSPTNYPIAASSTVLFHYPDKKSFGFGVFKTQEDRKAWNELRQHAKKIKEKLEENDLNKFYHSIKNIQETTDDPMECEEKLISLTRTISDDPLYQSTLATIPASASFSEKLIPMLRILNKDRIFSGQKLSHTPIEFINEIINILNLHFKTLSEEINLIDEKAEKTHINIDFPDPIEYIKKTPVCEFRPTLSADEELFYFNKIKDNYTRLKNRLEEVFSLFDSKNDQANTLLESTINKLIKINKQESSLSATPTLEEKKLLFIKILNTYDIDTRGISSDDSFRKIPERLTARLREIQQKIHYLEHIMPERKTSETKEPPETLSRESKEKKEAPLVEEGAAAAEPEQKATRTLQRR